MPVEIRRLFHIFQEGWVPTPDGVGAPILAFSFCFVNCWCGYEMYLSDHETLCIVCSMSTTGVDISGVSHPAETAVPRRLTDWFHAR